MGPSVKIRGRPRVTVFLERHRVESVTAWSSKKTNGKAGACKDALDIASGGVQIAEHDGGSYLAQLGEEENEHRERERYFSHWNSV